MMKFQRNQPKQLSVSDLVHKLKLFADKEYRDGYLHAHVRTSIAFQMRALRKKFNLSQKDLAVKTGKTQSVVSRLESADYGRMSVQTLLDVASGLNVALVVRFASYPEFLNQAANMAEKDMQPETINESLSAAESLAAEQGVATAVPNKWYSIQSQVNPAPRDFSEQLAAAQSSKLARQSPSALIEHNRAAMDPKFKKTNRRSLPHLKPDEMSL